MGRPGRRRRLLLAEWGAVAVYVSDGVPVGVNHVRQHVVAVSSVSVADDTQARVHGTWR